MKILAIETSCDETAIAILAVNERGSPTSQGSRTSKNARKLNFKLLSNVVLSQVKIHKPFGGVVPNLAMREHQKNLVPILIEALRDAKMLKNECKKVVVDKISLTLSTILSREQILLVELQKFVKKYAAPDVDVIAATHGPGLEPALWIGINFAKALSTMWNKPLIPVNHLEGHIYASWLPKCDTNLRIHTNTTNKKFGSLIFNSGRVPQFPILALIVSGGHTELVLIKKHLHYKILGETRDDAAGEAFDKVAKMLGLGYPGGPEIARIAEKGNPRAISFPRPMIHSNNFDFSFSGLKTAVMYHLRENQLLFESASEPAKRESDTATEASKHAKKQNSERVKTREKQLVLSAKANIAASFEQAVVDVLISKTARALRQYRVKALVVGGGVAANTKLRSSLESLITHYYPLVTLCLSPVWLTGDNAAMIAVAAYFRSLTKKKFDVAKISANGNLKLQ